MKRRGVWLAVLAVMMVMTTTVSALRLTMYSGMIRVPGGEALWDPQKMRYYSIPPDGGTHALEIGAWPNWLINSFAVAGVDEEQLLKATNGAGFAPVDIRPISRVQFKVYNPRTYEILLDFDGSLEEFLSLGTLLPDDYGTPTAFKFHLPVEFPPGVECWYAGLVIWAGDSRDGHADMRIYAGGYRRFVDTYGMWY
ncbi:MAG TPA: hypothetical protein VM366_08465 [Anaerolineae bacterium]|nr:hypothetical protein [Anaerolineae bacterium]